MCALLLRIVISLIFHFCVGLSYKLTVKYIEASGCRVTKCDKVKGLGL